MGLDALECCGDTLLEAKLIEAKLSLYRNFPCIYSLYTVIKMPLQSTNNACTPRSDAERFQRRDRKGAFSQVENTIPCSSPSEARLAMLPYSTSLSIQKTSWLAAESRFGAYANVAHRRNCYEAHSQCIAFPAQLQTNSVLNLLAIPCVANEWFLLVRENSRLFRFGNYWRGYGYGRSSIPRLGYPDLVHIEAVRKREEDPGGACFPHAPPPCCWKMVHDWRRLRIRWRLPFSSENFCANRCALVLMQGCHDRMCVLRGTSASRVTD